MQLNTSYLERFGLIVIIEKGMIKKPRLKNKALSHGSINEAVSPDDIDTNSLKTGTIRIKNLVGEFTSAENGPPRLARD